MQRLTYPSIFLIALIAFITFESCADHDLITPCEPVSYSLEVVPIVQSKCAIQTCHNGDNGADINWKEYSNLRLRALSGKLKDYVVNHIMPPAESAAGPLTDQQIRTIACWADNGALNN